MSGSRVGFVASTWDSGLCEAELGAGPGTMQDARLSEALGVRQNGTGAMLPNSDTNQMGGPGAPAAELLGSEDGVDGADDVKGILVSSPGNAIPPDPCLHSKLMVLRRCLRLKRAAARAEEDRLDIWSNEGL